MMKGSAEKYGRLAQWLHWLSAILIIVLWPIGFSMVRMPNSSAQMTLYQVHVSIGLLVALLTIIRAVWHFMDDRPAAPDGLTSFNRKLFQWTHNLLYVVLFILAVSGMAMLLSNNLGLLPGNISPAAIVDGPPRVAHAIVSKVFMLLLVAHLAGVVRHQLTKGNTLARMGISGRLNPAGRKLS